MTKKPGCKEESTDRLGLLLLYSFRPEVEYVCIKVEFFALIGCQISNLISVAKMHSSYGYANHIYIIRSKVFRHSSVS